VHDIGKSMQVFSFEICMICMEMDVSVVNA
jgi:hypothetical protein